MAYVKYKDNTYKIIVIGDASNLNRSWKNQYFNTINLKSF